MIVRRKFPQIYELEHPKNGRYWLVSARSAKWGMNERKTFPKEALAKQFAGEIEKRIVTFGRQPDIPKEKIQAAASYENLTVKLPAISNLALSFVFLYQKFWDPVRNLHYVFPNN